jgi:GxxExxY protein
MDSGLHGTALSERVIGLAIEVHRTLGPGLLESVYEECLCLELARIATAYRRQVSVPVVYRELRLECGFRLDVLVAEESVLEIKAVDTLQPVHDAQLLTDLRLGNFPAGLLINFNATQLVKGLRRFSM